MKKFNVLFVILLVLSAVSFHPGDASAAGKQSYYFVYNSTRMDAADLAAVKGYVSNFKSTNNVMVDAKAAKTAADVYDLIKRQSKGDTAGVQIFGLASDVPSFSYAHKMRIAEAKEGWTGIGEYKDQTFVTDYFYSSFANSSKDLSQTISVYAMIQDKAPISMKSEWPVSRLPVTKGDYADYIKAYNEYRKQVSGAQVPTSVLSVPTVFQDNYAQNDAALFIERLKKEFGLLSKSPLQSVYENITQEMANQNKKGIYDFVFAAPGDKKGVNKKDKFVFDAKTAESMKANYYTAMFWGVSAAEGLDADSVVYKGLTEGKMINPIALTVTASNAGSVNYVWSNVPAPAGKTGDQWMDYVAVNDELLQNDNPFFFIKKYYEGIEQGKSRLQSFHESRAAYADLSVERSAEHLTAAWGYGNVISLQYLGLADY